MVSQRRLYECEAPGAIPVTLSLLTVRDPQFTSIVKLAGVVPAFVTETTMTAV